jgi:hypothetical protein
MRIDDRFGPPRGGRAHQEATGCLPGYESQSAESGLNSPVFALVKVFCGNALENDFSVLNVLFRLYRKGTALMHGTSLANNLSEQRVTGSKKDRLVWHKDCLR